MGSYLLPAEPPSHSTVHSHSTPKYNNQLVYTWGILVGPATATTLDTTKRQDETQHQSFCRPATIFLLWLHDCIVLHKPPPVPGLSASLHPQPGQPEKVLLQPAVPRPAGSQAKLPIRPAADRSLWCLSAVCSRVRRDLWRLR